MDREMFGLQPNATSSENILQQIDTTAQHESQQ
jgi:hypothetical protein